MSTAAVAIREEVQAVQALGQAPMEAIDETARQRVAQALESVHAPSTRRVYASAWAAWEAHASAKGYNALPASPEAVAAYLAELADQGQSKSALNLARAAIAHVHRSRDLPSPADHEGVKRVLKGLRREDTRPAQQAMPLTATALAAIEATAHLPRSGRGGHTERPGYARQRGMVDIALCRVLRDALLRRSECAALCWGHLTRLDGGAATVLIERSKTDQEGEGQSRFLSVQTVKALDAIRPEEASAAASIFGLNAAQIGKRVAAAASAAGLGEGFNGHSGRVGMAQDLAASGAELPALMQAGGWKSSQMPARYTAKQAAARGAVAQYYGE